MNPLPAVAALLLSLAAGTALGDPAAASSIPTVDLIQPAELAASLAAPGARPLVLQVGSRVLYTEAHIPGAEYAGPAGQDGGRAALRERVKALPRDTALVIYCGCCPWSRCPNIAAAYEELRSLGFTRVKALYVGDNFGADWVDKGYPVARGR